MIETLEKQLIQISQQNYPKNYEFCLKKDKTKCNYHETKFLIIATALKKAFSAQCSGTNSGIFRLLFSPGIKKSMAWLRLRKEVTVGKGD